MEIIIVLIIIGIIKNAFCNKIIHMEKYRKINYKDYLKTTHWHIVRAYILKKYNYRCGKCGSKNNLQVHHKSYANLWSERENDLICLCSSCHKKVHHKK